MFAFIFKENNQHVFFPFQGKQSGFEIDKNLSSPMMSTSETEIKAEIKEEISDGFSTEDKRAFEFAQNLPIQMLPTAKVGN